jgi:hypothetical protein
VEDLRADSALLPSPVSTPFGNITLDRNRFSFSDWEIRFLDANLPASGTITNYLEHPRRAEVRLDGELGPQAARWTADLLDAPAELKLDRTVRINNAELVWEEGFETLFSGTLVVAEGPKIVLDLKVTEEAFLCEASGRLGFEKSFQPAARRMLP